MPASWLISLNPRADSVCFYTGEAQKNPGGFCHLIDLVVEPDPKAFLTSSWQALAGKNKKTPPVRDLPTSWFPPSSVTLIGGKRHRRPVLLLSTARNRASELSQF